MTTNELIHKMALLGYYYDEIDSYEGWLNFIIPSTGSHIEFTSWENCEEWYNEVID